MFVAIFESPASQENIWSKKIWNVQWKYAYVLVSDASLVKMNKSKNKQKIQESKVTEEW